jgi:predicted CoA-binding protein
MSQPPDAAIRALLQRVRTIAVVGLSPDPTRPSHHVAAYLLQQGYRIFPINPTTPEVLGQRSYASLAEVPEPIDLVDVFRRSDAVPAIIDEVLSLGLPAVWLQEGVTHAEAEAKARTAGVVVVADRCILKEHVRLLGA